MHAQKSRTFRKRLVPLAAVALSLGAMVGVAQLGANFNTGASARPVHTGLATNAPANKVVHSPKNTSPAATVKYWSASRLNNARELVPTRSDVNGASFGSSGLDFTRSRITPQSANLAAPYRTTGKIFFTEPGIGDFQCSGSVIAKRLVITAAHCLNSGHGWYTNWVFIPAYDGSKPTLATQRPLGTWTANNAWIHTNWLSTNGALPNPDDFGALVINDQSFGGPALKLYQKAGKYNFAVGHLFDTHVTMLGYPCNFDSCNIMQRVDSSDHRVPPGYTGSNVYEYGSDMTGGSSGGPWLENFGIGDAPQGGWTARNTVVGVTSYVYNDAAVLVEGAAQLNADWSAVYGSACGAASTGNC